MFRRVSLLVLLAGLSSSLFAQAPSDPNNAPSVPPLLGTIDGDMYTSPTGAFRIRIPVLPALSGTVTDTPNVVTFQDPYSVYISIACFPQDATQRWKLETMGTRDYLEDFFYHYVWRDFAPSPGARYERNARFLPHLLGGAFVTYITLPGGSMFYNPANRIDPGSKPPEAKRGNLMFVHEGYMYVISMEMAEQVTEGSAFHVSNEVADLLLRDRLTAIAKSIHFLNPAPAP